MGYKVNRVGTPFMDQQLTAYTPTFNDAYVAARDNINTSATYTFLSLNPATYDKFGVVNFVGIGPAVLPANHRLGFGQLLQPINVVIGNATLIECTAQIEGRLADRIAITHRFGYVTGVPVDFGSQALLANIPVLLSAQDQLSPGTDTSLRRFVSREVVMPTALTLETSLLAHFIEIIDTGVTTDTSISEIRIKLAMRGIDTSDVLYPFDPSR